MRRLVWLTVLGIALAVPAVGYAVVGGSSDDGTLSVKSGAGRVFTSITGSAVGRLGKGSIKITDPNPNDGLGPEFSGCDATPDTGSSATTICQSDGKGTVVRFRAIGGKYLITLKGSGIFLSAVGQGYATLNGAGNDPTFPGTFDGVYSVNDGPYKSLPDETHAVTLGTPAGG
jgi:hypothetical protein